ncbi:hypothetical protein [Phytohabitans aurantiacus]|jgi:hypothetical protein|uniref:Major facilitator superfamily (MFS) profile domain-containing protein n=1 Tax=Phytohabitans aurantiacus TaxID=3016789 RepID=A0ABQ5R440_9ACTN|nr:hypothetical protein [Phytohabitans aurantiacus]GLI01313.1 hypothetical protein Pa4123_65890 [Phytohabitans aurantiacus]
MRQLIGAVGWGLRILGLLGMIGTGIGIATSGVTGTVADLAIVYGVLGAMFVAGTVLVRLTRRVGAAS